MTHSLPIIMLLLSFPLFADTPGLVPLAKIDATILSDMRYGFPEKNSTGRAFYNPALCVVRLPVAMALARAQQLARLQGYNMKVLDCYRPVSVHSELWAALPKALKLHTPKDCGARCSGAVVDVTLALSNGADLDMPGAFESTDSKGSKMATSARGYKNHRRLVKLMEGEGFRSVGESWHGFQYTQGTPFPVEDVPLKEFK